MKYDFDQVVERRGSGSVKWDNAPEGTIAMGMADTDFLAPPVVMEAIRARADHGVFGYGQRGVATEALTGWYRRNYSVAVDPEWLVFYAGIVPALAVAALVCEGDVIVQTPIYHFMFQNPERAGKRTVRVPLAQEGTVYRMDIEAMERSITKDVGILYFCNPHNPVGRVFTREELEEVSAFAERHSLVVVSDEVHGELVYDRPHIPFFTVSEYARDHSVVLSGPGKTYNLPGLPFSYAVIPNLQLRENFQKAGYAMGNPGVLAVAAAKAAYSQAEDWRDELVDYLRGNRDYLEAELARRFPAAAVTHSEGTFLQWIDFRPLGIEDPAAWLAEKAGVMGSGGGTFGQEGYVRLNFGTRRSLITEALDRIEAAL